VPANDLEKRTQLAAKSKSDTSTTKSINNNAKTSHTPKPVGRVSKKEIMDGIKLMEQQNINLRATSKTQSKTAVNTIEADVEWNVIKKGKKVKIVKDSQSDARVPVERETEVSVTKTIEVISIPSPQPETVSSSNKKTTTSVTNANNAKSKKSKGKKSKKKGGFTMTKQDGFEIIEPDFGSGSASTNDDAIEDVINDDDEEEQEEEETTTHVEEEEQMSEIISDNNAIECEQKEISIEPENVDAEKQLVVDDELLEREKETEAEPAVEKLSSDETIVVEEISRQVFNVESTQKKNSKIKDADDAIIDISDEEICRKTSIEIDLSIAQEIAKIESEEAANVETEKSVVMEKETVSEQAFEDSQYFNDRKNIAELERDLVENLKILDDGIDIKCPVINPLYDFPITSAVRKWLHEKEHESFENLFRVENFKKLSELYDDCDDDDDESDISDSPQKSEATDSDYASDIQVKLNGSPASSNAKLDTKKLSSKCNNKIIVKESLCALM
jgi:hypothetical protein